MYLHLPVMLLWCCFPWASLSVSILSSFHPCSIFMFLLLCTASVIITLSSSLFHFNLIQVIWFYSFSFSSIQSKIYWHEMYKMHPWTLQSLSLLCLRLLPVPDSVFQCSCCSKGTEHPALIVSMAPESLWGFPVGAEGGVAATWVPRPAGHLWRPRPCWLQTHHLVSLTSISERKIGTILSYKSPLKYSYAFKLWAIPLYAWVEWYQTKRLNDSSFKVVITAHFNFALLSIAIANSVSYEWFHNCGAI